MSLSHFCKTKWGSAHQAVLLHGSSLNQTADSYSDLDLLLVVPGAPGAYESIKIGQFDCDLFAGDLAHIAHFCAADVPSNNHFILRSVASGRILYDPEHVFSQVQRNACQRWEQGPVQASETILEQIRLSAVKSRKFLEKAILRGARDMIWLATAVTRASHFLSQLIDCYCRVHRLWSHSFWHIAASEGEYYGPLPHMMREYLNDPDRLSQCNRVIAFARLVEEAATRSLICKGGAPQR